MEVIDQVKFSLIKASNELHRYVASIDTNSIFHFAPKVRSIVLIKFFLGFCMHDTNSHRTDSRCGADRITETFQLPDKGEIGCTDTVSDTEPGNLFDQP